MTRETFPFVASDISALAKSLRHQLAGREGPPSHVEMLNMLARAAGRRNFQHFRAEAAGAPAPALPATAPRAPTGAESVHRAARHFDAQGRLARWPGRRAQQELCVWVLWSRLPADQVLSEAEVNARLNAQHLFGDHAILRRSLCNSRLLARTPDGREYRRVERAPPPDAAALIQRVKPTTRPG